MKWDQKDILFQSDLERVSTSGESASPSAGAPRLAVLVSKSGLRPAICVEITGRIVSVPGGENHKHAGSIKLLSVLLANWPNELLLFPRILNV